MDNKLSDKEYSVECCVNKVVNVVLNAKCYMASDGDIKVDVGSGMLVIDEGIYELSVFLNISLGSFGSMLVFLKEEDVERLILALQEAIKDFRRMKLQEGLCEGQVIYQGFV